MLALWQHELFALFNVIIIDIVLAGDNAIVVGLAASRVQPHMRSKVIFWGISSAVVLRILCAGITTHLLQIVGLTLAGGILLLWVCWKMYRQFMMADHGATDDASSGAQGKKGLSFGQAVTQVVLADLTMSVDNVLAVAGAAHGSLPVLIIGLTIGIGLMGLASHLIVRVLERYPSITWVGLLIVVYVALSMIWDGWHQVSRQFSW